MPTIGIPLLLTDDVPKILAVPATNSVDTCTVGVSDPLPNVLILTLISAVDSGAVLASDAAQAPVRVLSTTDSLAGQLSDVIPTLFKSTEGIPLHIDDQAAIAVVQAVTDDLVVGLNDARQPGVSGRYKTDDISLGLTDVAVVAVPFNVTDAIALPASDATPTVNQNAASTVFLSAIDTSAVIGTEGALIEFVSLVASDTCATQIPNVGVYEDVSIFAFTPQQFIQILVTDTCVVEVLTPPLNTTFVTASDSCVIVAVEPTDNSHTFSSADVTALLAAEASSVNTGVPSQAQFFVTDSLALGESESVSTVKTVFDIFLATADSCAITASDLGTLTFNLVFLSTTEICALVSADVAQPPLQLVAVTDSLAVLAVEPTDAMAFPGVFDNVRIQASEGTGQIAGSFSFNVNDTLAVQELESAPTFPVAQAVSASESLRVVPVEGGPLVASSVLASEILGIGLNDASLLVLKFIALTDALGISLTDASSLFNSFIQVAAADTNSVQAADVINFVQQSLTQLATAESLSASLSDAATDVFSTATFTDGLLADAQELVSLLKALSTIDSVRWAIDSENANIINPFVVNSTISVEDFVTSDVTENAGNLPSRLTLFVADECAGQLDDVALTENIPIPDTLDFRIDISFKEISDPQSFQTVSSKFW